MKFRILPMLCGLTMTLSPLFSQGAASDAIELINSKLLHSYILRIDNKGEVKMRTPSETLTFNIKDTAFSYNRLNNDSRVRIAGPKAIEVWDGTRGDAKDRESFQCRSHLSAQETIDALRRLRNQYLEKDPASQFLSRKLNVTETGLEYKTLLEAMDFINDNLEVSVLLKVEPTGILTLGGQRDLYRVDLKKAEFCLNDLNNDPKVRIYGEWCIEADRDDQKDRDLVRESFSVRSRHAALDVIKALYYIKGTFTGLNSTQIGALRNVTGKRLTEFTSVPEAIEFINDRLAVSIIQGIDPRGEMVINAPEAIYHIALSGCSFKKPEDEHWFRIRLHDNSESGVIISKHKGIQKYVDGRFYDALDEETFSCRYASDIPRVMQALEFIQTRQPK